MNSIQSQLSMSIDWLKNKLETSIPDEGDFPVLSKTIPFAYNQAPLLIELSIGPWVEPDSHSKVKDWQKMRHLKLTVSPQNEDVSSSAWIYNGTNSQLKETLESKTQVLSYIEEIFKKSIENLQRNLNVNI